MARQRNPNRDRAKEIYDEHVGDITNREIAKLVGEDERTIAVWKGRDNWNGPNVVQQKKKANVVQQKKVNKKLMEAVEENDELNDAQKLFCLHFVKTFNATAAYMRAYPDASYTTAMKGGWDNLRNPKIQAEIKRLKAMRVSAELLADGADVVEKMMQIGFSDITDYVEFVREEVPVMAMFGPVMVENEEGEKEQLTKEINVVKFKDSAVVDGTIITEVKQGRDGASVKLADKMKALEWLAKYFELNPMDKHKRDYDDKRLALEEKKAATQDFAPVEVVRIVDDI